MRLRANDFTGSLVLAAALAALYPAFALVAEAVLAPTAALSLYLLAAATVYAAALAPRPSRALAAGALAGALGGIFLLLARDVGDVAVGAGLAIGVTRSGLLYRRPAARAIALETLLLGGGLLVARALFAPGLLGTALSLWGFLLVQSPFFLVGPLRERRPEGGGDPFERARARAEAILEGP